MTQPRTMVHRRVDAARFKRNPAVIFQMPSGWLIMTEEQYTPGCCQLLPDPVVQDLNSLDKEGRVQFLSDMVIIGDAIMEVAETYCINYEIKGGVETSLYADIMPRYKFELEKYQKLPAWFSYEIEKKLPPRFELERDQEMMKRIANSIQGKL
jgi:diadenosine tetraphosphate (Ap4A) HIT family hydrolase